MDNLPFGHGGRLFRGNLHAHSTRSDGGLPPDAVCAAYRRQGYDFAVLTDHFLPEYGFPITDTAPFRVDGFTTLLGAELHAPALANGEPWHIVAVGLPPDFAPPTADEDGPALAQRAAAAGAFVGLAHPAWSGATVADLASVSAAHAVEVFNAVCGRISDRADSWGHLDRLLAAGHRLFAVGADDAHFRDVAAAGGGSDPERHAPAAFAAWVWVRADRPEPDALLAALRAGRFYTSQGPRLHDVLIDRGQACITVHSSPAVSLLVVGDPRRRPAGQHHGMRLTEGTFSLEPFAGSYCRIVVVDDAGKRAWSNPIWLD
jgi:hypothetical protein